MILNRLKNREPGGYTSFGSVWNKGEVTENEFVLINADGIAIPVQSRVTAGWPDGSIKWAAHTADSSIMGERVILKPSFKAEYTGKIKIGEENGFYIVDAGRIRAKIPFAIQNNSDLTEEVYLDGIPLVKKAYPVFWLEHRSDETKYIKIERTFHTGCVKEVVIEESGPLQCIIKFSGGHLNGTEPSMPFVIRMYLSLDSPEIKFVHTFLFDGAEETDFMAGMGIRFDSLIKGEPYNRHIKYAVDQDRCFHETSLMMWSRIPKVDESVLQRQMEGNILRFDSDSAENQAASDLPKWNKYSICQDSPSHFVIKKRTEKGCCEPESMHGNRAPGVMSVNGETGGILLGIRDFWQKYPSGLEVENLADEASCTAWFYSPEASAMDFRHYSKSSYPMTCYEGFDFVGASAYGIGVTSECAVCLNLNIPTDEAVNAFGRRMQKPPVYVGTPEYYHEKRAFGYWSLKKCRNKTENILETHMERIAAYYISQVEQCNWYGLFNYGDFMHSYDRVRHCWKYDVGGFAWQNTELVPTYWLWFYFLRTGRDDIYTLAEAMSRHCSEVDIYHFGRMKGLGSRHNVRHWGCSCKEPRVAMAGHHRFLYYLSGDRRIGDVMDDVRDADYSIEKTGYYVQRHKDSKTVMQIRSGPDWSSFVSNLMTCYERYTDENCRKKIETGIESIQSSPLGLASGPSFEYHKESGELVYAGETPTGDTHLQLCMGAPQIWMEMADMLEDETFKRMLADYGRFYLYTPEEKNKQTNGRIGERPFNMPYVASAMAAYAAEIYNDIELAHVVWRVLLNAARHGKGDSCLSDPKLFDENIYAVRTNGEALIEIPWMSTNFAAQWCLNIIVVLDLIREYLPDDLDMLDDFLNEPNPDIYIQP